MVRAVVPQVVALDESGNTGPDLLNRRQPIFALASVRLDDALAREVLAPVSTDAAEAKFSVLRQDPEGRERILAVLRSDLITPETARVSVFHKPYTTVAKMVDLLMEPGFYKRDMGDEFRTDGHALKWPIALYELAPKQLGDVWEALLTAFIAAVRKPSPTHTAEVQRLIAEALERHPDPRVEFPLQVFAEQAPEELGNRSEVDPLDPAIPALIDHMAFWGDFIGPFDLRHDQADSLERYRDHIGRLCDPNTEPFEFRANDRIVRYPLRARSIEFVKSDDVPQVQVADLLAGACAFQQGAFTRPTADAAFAQAVAETGIRRIFAEFVAPPEFVSRSMRGVFGIGENASRT